MAVCRPCFVVPVRYEKPDVGEVRICSLLSMFPKKTKIVSNLECGAIRLLSSANELLAHSGCLMSGHLRKEQ